MPTPNANALLSPRDIPHRARRECELFLKRRVFAAEDAAVRWLDTQYRALYATLRSAAYDHADRIGLRKVSQDGNSAAWRRAFLFTAEPLLKAFSDRIAAEMLRRATTVYVGSYVGRVWLLDVTTREDVHIPKTFPRNPIASALSPVREDVYDDAIRDLLGREWRAMYGTELDDLILRIRRALNSGLLEGEGIDDVMRRVRDAMGVETDRRRGQLGSAQRAGYRANFNRVQAITRTVINQVSSNAAVEAYRANKDILSGYQWLAARDERVCPQCAGLNGTVYRLNDAIRPPAHPNCRCTVIPMVDYNALVPDDTPPRQSLAAWARDYGMGDALAGFLYGLAA